MKQHNLRPNVMELARISSQVFSGRKDLQELLELVFGEDLDVQLLCFG